MKSKTSSFNKTVFKKNLTRFAPVMAVYTPVPDSGHDDAISEQ